MRIKSRWVLILLLIASQVGCLAFGFTWGGKWLHIAFSQINNTRIQTGESTLLYELASQTASTSFSYVLVASMVGWIAIFTWFLFGRYEDSLAKANANLEKKVRQRTRALLRTRNAVIIGLAKLAESRDQDTGKHLESIRSYVTVLANELAKNHSEINHQYVADLAVASSLHDIGKVGIPDAILLKPSSLTPAERQVMQLHTVLGSECLAAIQQQLEDDDFLELAQEIASGHHEHWDGNGYPHGLKRENIPLAARIVALADVYDALTSSRPYKGPCSHSEACERIVSLYAKQFDPEVVEAFIARERDFSRICKSSIESPPDDNLQSFKSIKMLVEAQQTDAPTPALSPVRQPIHRPDV